MAETKLTRRSEKLIDLTGKHFGKLKVIERGPNIGLSAGWICQCDCGNTKLINGTSLRGGRSFSCGCNRISAGHRRIIDLLGQRFGRLLVVALSGSNGQGKALWQCRCDCGQEIITEGKALRSGHTQSCGCWRQYVTGEYSRTHGMSGTMEHKSWKAAKQRCLNPKDASYNEYGGRGITMCQEWADSFEAFYAHIGLRPKGCSLDRIDNEKGYEPGNVRWATKVIQNNNRRKRRWHRKPKVMLSAP